MGLLNERSDAAAVTLLDAMPAAQRTRLLTALAEVHRLLPLAAIRIAPADPAGPMARGCLRQYFGELDRRFESGFDPGAGTPVDDREFVPPAGVFLVACVDGVPVACGAVRTIAPGIGNLKRMWVAETVRGQGIGRRLLEALEAEARKLGLTSLRLDTNRALQAAIRLYRSAGFHQIAPFNADPYAHHWFEKRLD